MKPRQILVDADILVHRSCSAVERDTRFLDRWHILFSDAEEAFNVVEEMLHDITEDGGTDEVLLVFSGPENWRKKLGASYKGHRKGSRKPLAYWAVVEKLKAQYPFAEETTLEADDLMGIIQTDPKHPFETIIWSLDKDLRQIPGLHIDLDELVTVHPQQAYLFHMEQTLTGDPADNYPGCPGVGKATAQKILNGGLKVVPVEHVLKRGPRKGETEIRWEEARAESPWETVVSLFEKAGLTEEDALLQARLANILHASQYENGEVVLWNAP